MNAIRIMSQKFTILYYFLYYYLCKTHLFNNLNQNNNSMTKEEIISQIAADADTTKVQARASLESFIDCVSKTLKKGGKISLVGFGTFSVSKRKARTGRNPKTGAPIEIKARKVAKFKAGKNLSETVNK
jgi:DNA-binding protein HU-beta